MTQDSKDEEDMIIYQRIEALVDGELDHDQAAQLLDTIEKKSAFKNYYEKITKQNEDLKKWWSVYKKDH